MRSETRMKGISFCTGSYIKVILSAVVCSGGVVFAEWDVGDPALYYQLPEESDGWSVYGDGGGAESVMLADDWTAGASAPITDIYFWGGWHGGAIGQTGEILIQIFNNNPAEQKPDGLVWSRAVPKGQYTAQLYQAVPQGFYDPRFADEWSTQDHDDLFEYSITISKDCFVQEAGQTYWLMISTNVEGGMWGWNTAAGAGPDLSGAVFYDATAGWIRLLTPTGYQDPRMPLDMAFVITPEPCTLILLGLACPLGRTATRKRKV